MKYSVVIPVLGNTHWLDALLQSLEANCRRRHAEVVIVDDASGSRDTEYLESLRKSKRADVLIEHGSRRGFAAAVNTGVRNATADTVFVMHTDVVVGPNTLGRLSSRLKPFGPADVVSAICCYSPHSAYELSRDMRHRFVEMFKPSNKPPCSRDDITASIEGFYGDFASFCRSARITRPDMVYTTDGYFFTAAFRKDTWEMVGEMDETLGCGFAERLWVDRLCLLGGQMYVDRSTYCHHHGNATSDGPGMCYDKLFAEYARRYESARRDMLRREGGPL
jgi:GT2 family glycosyltransferase